MRVIVDSVFDFGDGAREVFVWCHSPAVWLGQGSLIGVVGVGVRVVGG